MAEILVRHERDDRFEINVRGHQLYVDQPVEDGGTDTAPTPTELLVASLASCVGFYARRYLARHELPVEGLAVSASWTMAAQPARVGHIDVHIVLPKGVPDERRGALLAVASHCTVHNTLSDGPMVRVALAEDAVAA